MGTRNPNPIEEIPGIDVFRNVVLPGDVIAMATKSYGSANINKGRYLGQRKPLHVITWRKDFKNYIVEQDKVSRLRTNAQGRVWSPWQTKNADQYVTLHAAIGDSPARPKQNVYDRDVYNNPELKAQAQKDWEIYTNLCLEHSQKTEAWLDIHYPYLSTPYIRKSTLWLNKIIKL